jgi:hypothetical protein
VSYLRVMFNTISKNTKCIKDVIYEIFNSFSEFMRYKRWNSGLMRCRVRYEEWY